MSSAKHHHVTIKGVKDGLVFLLDDQCDFEALIAELRHKLAKTHQQILTGPAVHVQVKMGKRHIVEEQKETIRSIISQQGNLLIQSIESDPADAIGLHEMLPPFMLRKGVVRSGQTVACEGNLMFVGDVNPGGSVISTGDIYVMGSLRGMAHAGSEGNEQAVIAASHLRPTQLRIAQVISRPPDEWGIEEASMEFAYLQEQQMKIEKISQLHRIRPGNVEYKGE